MKKKPDEPAARDEDERADGDEDEAPDSAGDADPAKAGAAKDDADESSPDEDDAGDEDADDDEDDEEEEEAEAQPASTSSRLADERKRKALSAVAKKSAPSKPSERPKRARVTAVDDEPSGLSPMMRGAILVVLGLAVGGGGGWFLRDAKAKGRAPFKAAAASSGIATECKAWQTKICDEAGDTSAGCAQAQSAAELLSNAACTAALEDVPGTLTRIQQARQTCVDLADKLCADLGKDSSTCDLVKKKTGTIPPEGCKSMMGNYEAVLAQLRMLEQQGGMMPGGQGGPHGAPGGMRAPMRMPTPVGMPPGHPAPAGTPVRPAQPKAP